MAFFFFPTRIKVETVVALSTVVITAKSLTVTFIKVLVLLAIFVANEARHFLADIIIS